MVRSSWTSPTRTGAIRRWTAARALDFLPSSARAAAAPAWADAWTEHLPGGDPVRALGLAEPLAHLPYAVRYQEFLDRIERSERPYHEGDPAGAIRRAVRCLEHPSPFLAELRLP